MREFVDALKSDLVSRRSVLGGSASVGFVGLIGGMNAATAASGQVVVASWGGDWNDRTVKYCEGPFTRSTGVKVVHNLGPSEQVLTKLPAERRLARGTIDVAQVEKAMMAAQLAKQGVLEELDWSRIPNSVNLYKGLSNPYMLPWQYSGWVLMVNPAKVANPPKSFADLWRPEYKGLVGLTDVHYLHHMEMAGLVNGGSMYDTPKIQSALLDLKKAVGPKLFPSHLQQAQAFKSGEIAISTNYRARIVQFAAEGLSVAPIYPSEGGISVIFGAVIPKNAPNKEAAYAYLNALIDPSSMAGLVQESYYSPAVRNVVLPPEVRSKIEFSENERERLHDQDGDILLQKRDEWSQWWNEVFKG